MRLSLFVLGSLSCFAALPAASADALAPRVSPPAAAQEEDEARVRRLLAEAQELLLQRVLKRAEEARELEYHSAARALFTTALALEPENDAARAGLGWRKRGGEWKEGRARPKRDKVEPEAKAAFDASGAQLIEDSIARIDAAFEGVKPHLQLRVKRRQALESLLAIAPDHAVLRERTGYAKDPASGTWALAEVVAARARVADNRALLQRIRSELPAARPSDPEDGASATGVRFTHTVGSEHMVASVDGMAGEAQSLHDLVLTELGYLREVLGRRPRYQMPQSLVGISQSPNKTQYFSNHPEVRQEDMGTHRELYGSWLGPHLVLSSPVPEERLDMATFLTTTVFLSENFGSEGDSGWIRQSLASYLSSQVCGTHLSFLVLKNEYGEADGPPWPERMPPTLSGWLSLARPFLADDQPMSNFARALSTPTVAMTWEDVAVGYAFAAYLCEGRRDDLLRLLPQLGRGAQKLPTIEATLGLPLPALRQRLAAWIDTVGTL